MLERGFKTLVDAFAVVQNEHLFNVFNSNGNVVEKFNEDNAKYYSQSQCAIALEREFSRIYKYLQFKSTTSETFQRHINIDSGYKYLTTDSLKNSDHELKYYYDEESDANTKKYLRYLKKLNEYVNSTSSDSGIGLNAAEKAILKEFCDILSKQTLDWLDKKWDLCPLLQRASEKIDELSPRKLMSKSLSDGASARDAYSDDGSSYDLYIVFNKKPFMSWEDTAEANIKVDLPSNLKCEWISSGNQLHVTFDGSVDLSKITLNVKPTYTYGSSISIDYSIAGYTLNQNSSTINFKANKTITQVDFGDSTILTIYVAWKPDDCVVNFDSDKTYYSGDDIGTMGSKMLS
jgi:hypothetical protein